MKRLLQLWPLAALIMVCLFHPQAARAQGGNISSVTFGPQGTPKAGVTVTVCTSTATVTNGVCAPAENDVNCCFTDSTLTVHLTPPVNGGTILSDGLGNYTVWAAPGQYKVSYSGAGVNASTLNVPVACVPLNMTSCGALLNGNNLWTGANSASGPWNFTGLFTGCKGNGAAYLDALNTCGWLGATPDLQIATIAAYLGPTGGNIYLGPGTFLINAQLTISTPVKIYGSGGAGFPTNSSTTPATILNCGIIAGPCIQFTSVSGAGNKKLQGVALEWLSIQCNDNAQIGLDIESVSHSSFRHLAINQCTTGAFHSGVVASLLDPKDSQFNDIKDVSIAEGIVAADAGAYCMELDGDSVSNFSGNPISDIVCTHKNGNGIFETNADHNSWEDITVSRASGGTGIGIYLHGNGTPTQSPRGEHFKRISAGAGLLVQDGGAIANSISGFSGDDIGRVPTITTGALGWDEFGLGTASGYRAITRGSGSTANVDQWDTSTAGLATCQLLLDLHVQKYQVCRDALDNWNVFDLVAGIARFQVLAGAATQVVAPSGQSVNLVTSGGGAIQVLGGSLQLPQGFPIQNLAANANMGLTLKKGSGAGNYTNATTTYAVADSTNLCFTVLIPTGWKLKVDAAGGIGTSTAVVEADVALTDNAACSTANAGILTEAPVFSNAAGNTEPFALNWVIAGDGASHSVALQFKTTNAADTANLLNSSATRLPTIGFTLMPSN